MWRTLLPTFRRKILLTLKFICIVFFKIDCIFDVHNLWMVLLMILQNAFKRLGLPVWNFFSLCFTGRPLGFRWHRRGLIESLTKMKWNNWNSKNKEHPEQKMLPQKHKFDAPQFGFHHHISLKSILEMY